MPKLVELEDGRVIEFPDGMTDAQIDANLRLSLAGEQGVKQAEAGAVERSNPSADQRGAGLFREQLSQAGSFGQTPQPEDMPEGAAAKLDMAGTIASLPFVAPTASALVTAPIATGKALLGGAIGSAALGEGGQWVGRRLPIIGGETAGKVLETVGGLVGGGVGAYTGPKVPVKELLSRLVGGKGLLSAALGGGESAAAKGAATQAAKAVAPEVARRAELDIAIKEARLAKIAADAERAKELHAARLAKASGTAPKVSKTGPRPVPDPAPRTEGATALKPEPEFIPDEAVSLVAEPLPFRPRGTTKPATNLGGPAKPGPAPTPPDELEATLQASIDAEKAKKAATATTRPFKGSMSLEDERRAADQFIPSQLEELATAMPKGEGPGTIAWSLGKRPRGPGDIPQVGELASNARAVAKNPDVPPDLAKRLEDFAERASKPTGRMMRREGGQAEPVLPRRSILTEYIDILKDPKWETVFGSDEMLRHATKLDAKLAALRSIEKLMAQ